MFQYFVDNGELTINPVASVNYAFKRSKKGRTGVITGDQVRQILLSIPCSTDDPENLPKETDMRDRALIALMWPIHLPGSAVCLALRSVTIILTTVRCGST